MGLMVRCPLTGVPCPKPITIEEKTFFLAEAEEPEDARKRREKAITEAIEDGYKVRSALEERQPYAFTCKICGMIQTCAYGMADISQNNPNVLFELGMMIALGKPTIILSRKDQEIGLKLPSDLNAIEVIPFTEYIDIIDQLREVVQKLPPPVSPPLPIDDLEDIRPQFAQELRKIEAEIVREFRQSIEEAKLDTILPREEKRKIPPELSERIGKLEETLKDLIGLGFTTDVKTAFLRGNFYYNQGKYNEALAAYNWSLELKPNHPTILNNRGIIYRCMERYDDALADYNRSLELGPDNPTVLMNRGVTYHHMERYNDALADYNRSLELKPNDPTTLSNRGITYSKLGRYEEALADFNRSLELEPDYPSPIYNLACLFSLQGKTDDALAYLKKAIDKDKKYREDAKTDEDFVNIRDDPRFKKLIEPD